MKAYKKSFSSTLFISLLIAVVLLLFTGLWLFDFISRFSDNAIIFLIVIYLLLFLLILLFAHLVNKSFTYQFSDQYLEIFCNFYFIKHKKVIFYHKRDLTVDFKSNFILDLFNEKKLRLSDKDGRRIISISLKKIDSNDIATFLIPREVGEKKPYIKNEDYIYNQKNTFIVILDFLIYFIFVYILTSIIISFVEIDDFKKNIMLYLFSFLILLAIFILYAFIFIAHRSNTKVKVAKNYINISYGKRFMREIIIPMNVFLSSKFLIIHYPKKLNNYKVVYLIGKIIPISFPINISISKSITNDRSNFNLKPKFKWKLYIITEILILLVSLGLGFLNIFISVIFFLLASYYFYEAYKYNFLIVEENNIIMKKCRFIHVYSYINKLSIINVRLIKLPFKYTYVILKLSKGRSALLINKQETDSLKSVLGYYKARNKSD